VQHVKYLNHNINNHFVIATDGLMLIYIFKPLEEMFNAGKGVDELVSAGAIIFKRLGSTGIKIGCGRET